MSRTAKEIKAFTLPVYNNAGKEIDTVSLDAKVFDGVVNSDCIHQAVNAYRANQRVGLASTKTMGEVSGGGRKPWRQKGTGRARAGSTRSPLWRHGGVVFGPHPRDFSYTIPQKIKMLALKSGLNAKINESNLMVLDEFSLEKSKTKEAVGIFSNLKLNPDKAKESFKVLLLVNKIDSGIKKALRNIDFLSINNVSDTHIYEVLTHKKIAITKKGLDLLTERLKK